MTHVSELVVRAEVQDVWEEPVPLNHALLPDWPADIFPGPVQAFVTGLAEATETPPELSALMVLSVLSTAAHGKYVVQIKPGYAEPVNIWTCIAMESANRKTAIVRAATLPLVEWESEQGEVIVPEIQKAQSDRKTLEARIAELRRQASKQDGSVNFVNASEEIAHLESTLPEVPSVPQIFAEDITPESLGILMAQNEGRMAIISDEGGIFDILKGRYSNNIPNLDVFLKGHAGSQVRVNRSSRGPVFLRNPALTFGLTPQPQVLHSLAEKQLRGRGLLARFLYALPASRIGYRTLDTKPLSTDVRKQYSDVVRAMLDHERACDSWGDTSPHRLSLSKEAFERTWHPFYDYIEREMRPGYRLEHVTDWAGKLPGAVARIAGLLHICRHAFDSPQNHQITTSDATAAIRIANALIEHALAVFDLMGADPALDGARKVWQWVVRSGSIKFTARDCFRDLQGSFKRMAGLQPALEVLQERHYIIERDSMPGPGRPSRLFDVNPIAIEFHDPLNTLTILTKPSQNMSSVNSVNAN